MAAVSDAVSEVTRGDPPGARSSGLSRVSLFVALLIALPVLAVVSSVLEGGGDTWVHLAETALARYVGNTALLLAMVAWGVVSMGVLTAWFVTAYRFPGRRILEWALVLPLAMPAYIMAYAYTDWLQFAGPVQSSLRALTGWQAREYWFPEVRSLWGAAAMLSFSLYPYVYLLARAAFLEMPGSMLEAGRLAGYGGVRRFFRIAVPLARPGIAAGAALALMETLADFGTVSYFGLEVFTTGIFKAWMSMGDTVAARQLSTCLLGFVVLVILLERASRGRAAYHSTGTRQAPRALTLRGAKAAIVFAASAAPVLFGFVLPAGLLGWLLLGDPSARWNPRMLGVVGDSLMIAAVTAFIAVALAVLMAYAARLSRARAVLAANRFASFGYALPGAVIAVGVLVPLGRLDNLLADALEQWLGIRVGLLLTGTIAALVYAYLVRFLAIALQTVEAGLAKVTPSMEDAARSLGRTPGATLASVHAPLLAPSLATAALLVFVDVMKELPASFALRPFNFDTLAITAYNLAKDERLAEAALPSLVIVAAGLLPLIFVTRRYLNLRNS
jgi:iron(III) transport system permease protein